MENQQLKSSLDKIIQNMILKLEIEVSESLKHSLIKICYEKIKKITFFSGSFCEKDSKSLLSEDHLLPVLSDLGLGLYISEVKEEQKRTKTEDLKLDKINF